VVAEVDSQSVDAEDLVVDQASEVEAAEPDEIDLASLIDPDDIADVAEEEDEDSDEDDETEEELVEAVEESSEEIDPVTENLSALSESLAEEVQEQSLAEAKEEESGEYDDIFDQNMIDEFNRSVEEQRVAREAKEKEIAEKVAALGLGKNVEETVTDDNMAEFAVANGLQEAINDFIDEKPESEATTDNFLEAGTDTDQILSEVASLENIDENSEDEEGDSGDKLIAEFEAFTGESDDEKPE
tara:strand:- start:8512 stop:9240 length:729 start_codon:yes stop_codon:yes gene_type:complete